MNAHVYHDTNSALISARVGGDQSVILALLVGGHVLHFPFVSMQCGFLQDEVQQIQVKEEFKILNRLSCPIKT
jgi:hypothetical protein